MIYHITFEKDWQQALSLGVYQTDSLTTEGFIHCSTQAQVNKVANAFYQGQKHLIVLVIDPKKLYSPLKWESPAHPAGAILPPVEDQEIFPHIYGQINLDAVEEIKKFKILTDGRLVIKLD